MNEWRQEKNEHMYTIELNSILTLICAHMQSITVIWAENFNEAAGSLAPISYFVLMGLAPQNLKLLWKSAIMAVCPKCPNSFCLFNYSALSRNSSTTLCSRKNMIIHSSFIDLKCLSYKTKGFWLLSLCSEKSDWWLRCLFLMQKTTATFCKLIPGLCHHLCIFPPIRPWLGH